jgi:hypothetical protein
MGEEGEKGRELQRTHTSHEATPSRLRLEPAWPFPKPGSGPVLVTRYSPPDPGRGGRRSGEPAGWDTRQRLVRTNSRVRLCEGDRPGARWSGCIVSG